MTELEALALGYVWGFQDGQGERPDEKEAHEFARHYAQLEAEFKAHTYPGDFRQGGRVGLPPIPAEFARWSEGRKKHT